MIKETISGSDSREMMSRYMSALTIFLVGFWVSVLGCFLLFEFEQLFLPQWVQIDLARVLTEFATLLPIGFLTLFYISLGLLATVLHRSWITWVGVSVMTTPLGGTVAYFVIRRHVRDTIYARR